MALHSRCETEVETLLHRFLAYPKNRKASRIQSMVCPCCLGRCSTEKEILLDEAMDIPPILWRYIRLNYLRATWLNRKNKAFNNVNEDIIHSLRCLLDGQTRIANIIVNEDIIHSLRCLLDGQTTIANILRCLQRNREKKVEDVMTKGRSDGPELGDVRYYM